MAPLPRFIDGDGKPSSCTTRASPRSDDPSDRLLYAIRRQPFANAVLGSSEPTLVDAPAPALMRWRFRLPRSSAPSIREIPEELYVRRIHKGSSGGNVGNTRWLRTYWSGSRPVMRAPYWRLSRDHAGIVLRAPIPWRKKMRLLGRLVWTMGYRWRVLLRELVEAFRR